MSISDVVKRIVDIFGSLFGIIIFSPVMIAVAIHIKRVSREGPVLADIPERVGKGGTRFRFFKFRSMIPHAHEWMVSQPELYKKYQDNGYKLDPDPRLIKGGKFIRKTSLDEFPQFFNVLLGSMSLVGPRAYYPFELDDQLNKHPEAKPLMDKVLSVKPGMTGLWQISGRSELTFPERVRLDAEYADKRSFLYDLDIILRTPYVVITGKGAL
jgi:exopolysaccharide production protein ExoY